MRNLKLTTIFCKKMILESITLYLHLHIYKQQLLSNDTNIYVTSIALGNIFYVFIHCSVIKEATKHFENMLQHALGPKVFRLLCI